MSIDEFFLICLGISIFVVSLTWSAKTIYSLVKIIKNSNLKKIEKDVEEMISQDFLQQQLDSIRKTQFGKIGRLSQINKSFRPDELQRFKLNWRKDKRK